MSLWLERLDELYRYNSYLQEAEQHRLACQAEPHQMRRWLSKGLYRFGACLAALGLFLQDQSAVIAVSGNARRRHAH